MGLFDIFKNKNPDQLKPDELEAANLFQQIIKGYAEGQPNYIPNGVVKLSIGLYHLAFERSNQSIVSLDKFQDPIAVASNPKLLQYLAIFEAIKDSIEQTASNLQVQQVYHDSRQIQITILQLLKYSAGKINEIR